MTEQITPGLFFRFLDEVIDLIAFDAEGLLIADDKLITTSYTNAIDEIDAIFKLKLVLL